MPRTIQTLNSVWWKIQNAKPLLSSLFIPKKPQQRKRHPTSSFLYFSLLVTRNHSVNLCRALSKDKKIDMKRQLIKYFPLQDLQSFPCEQDNHIKLWELASYCSTPSPAFCYQKLGADTSIAKDVQNLKPSKIEECGGIPSTPKPPIDSDACILS